MAERPDSLLHPTNGYAADRIRRDLGLSTAGRLAVVERELADTRMTLARDLKPFRGFRLTDGQTIATPDSSGLVHLIPEDGSGMSIGRPQPADLHRILFGLTPPETGCDCCPEDSTGEVIVTGTACITGTMVFSPELCKWTVRLIVDEQCLCDRCDVLNPPA